MLSLSLSPSPSPSLSLSLSLTLNVPRFRSALQRCAPRGVHAPGE